MGLPDKYSPSGGKLPFTGVKRTGGVDGISNAIRTVADWRTGIVADIRALGQVPPGSAPAVRSYTVKPGDTLGTIARAELGSADAYIEIFEANRDQLDDPNCIEPGQRLRIPARGR